MNSAREQYVIHYYNCVFGNCRVLLESVCVCVCVCLCVFCTVDNSKRNRSRNKKFENIVVGPYENSSDEFEIELRRIKVKVTVGIQNV